MDVREKLVELLADHCDMKDKRCVGCDRGLQEAVECKDSRFGKVADHLIAHGVTLQEECEGCAKATRDCIADLQESIKVLSSAQEWISVDERLPENDVMVIGYTPCDGFMFVGYYHEEPKFVGYYHEKPKYDWKLWRIVTAMRSTKIMKKKVTHWMPLPKPPKGE